MQYDLRQGDCLDVLATLADNSIDSIVTDPPYELRFMGKSWDSTGIANNPAMWAECLRVLKPGGHLLAFSGSRTYHRMTVAIEDAGFDIRDQIMWIYGSGFPKSLDVSKAIDKAAGAEREVVGVAGKSGSQRSCMAGDFAGGEYMATAAATDAEREWSGWGTALKPAHEPICVARKPLIGTVAANVLAHGTGAINIDASRVAMGGEYDPTKVQRQQSNRQTWEGGEASGFKADHEQATYNAAGRWPANVIHDGSPEVVEGFPVTTSGKQSGQAYQEKRGSGVFDAKNSGLNGEYIPVFYGDTGSASRFFYCAKASKKDRGDNTHPTVKPTDLMAYLVRLVTPAGGVTLDPFMGSGSTGKAAAREGFRFIGIERDPGYFDIARKRIEAAHENSPLFDAACVA